MNGHTYRWVSTLSPFEVGGMCAPSETSETKGEVSSVEESSGRDEGCGVYG